VSGTGWKRQMNMEAACCHLGGDQHIIGWIQAVFTGEAKLGTVMKPLV
jgi:hypothetical protein